MNKRLLLLISVLVITILFGVIIIVHYNKPEEVKPVQRNLKYTSKAENQKCLVCHAHQKFKLTNPEDSSQTIFQKMYAENIIDTLGYYHSNHYDFKCIDCHNEEYVKAPHKASLKFETVNACIDCHGGDETFAKFHFDTNLILYNKSIHAVKLGKEFSCYSCHNSHTYKTYYKDSLKSVHQVIEYSNAMCLDCHIDNNKMQYYEASKTDMEKAHQWLPNQKAHHENIRCIDCHVQSDPNVDVAHNVLPKSKAIRKCEVCHDEKSSTLNDIYLKRKSKEAVEKGLKPHLNDYVSIVRANNDSYIDIISLSFIMITLLAIGVHLFFRIKRRK